MAFERDLTNAMIGALCWRRGFVSEACLLAGLARTGLLFALERGQNREVLAVVCLEMGVKHLLGREENVDAAHLATEYGLTPRCLV